MVSRVSVVAMLALASCDSIFGLTGRTEKDAGTIDAEVIDTMVEIDAPPEGCPVHPDPTGDDDEDTISNQNDLCPDTFDTGNNEDGDCKADACDPCPQIYGDGGSDIEDDRIGQECDFAGESGTSDLRVFEGFDNADELEPVNMAIDHPTRTLRNTNPMAAAFGWANYEIPSTFQIETQFEVPASAPGNWSVGLIFGATTRGATPTGWAVALTRVTASEMRLRFFQVAFGGFVSQNMDQLVAPGPRMRLVVRVIGRQIAIETYNGSVKDSYSIMFPGTLPSGLQGDTSFGVTVTGGALASFDYLTELHHE